MGLSAPSLLNLCQYTFKSEILILLHTYTIYHWLGSLDTTGFWRACMLRGPRVVHEATKRMEIQRSPSMVDSGFSKSQRLSTVFATKYQELGLGVI